MAHAMLSPSNVLVPRPTSSSRMSERGVALLRMLAVSFISTRNVLSPAARLSRRADAREDRVHDADARARAAGTNAPTCASSTIEPDLPEHDALARHVGPGDEEDLLGSPRSSRAASGRVGDERLARRAAPAPRPGAARPSMSSTAAVVHVGADVAVALGDLGEARQNTSSSARSARCAGSARRPRRPPSAARRRAAPPARTICSSAVRIFSSYSFSSGVM